MLKINLCKSEKEFVEGQREIPESERSFLQSYEYGQMQSKLGNEPLYIILSNENNQVVDSYLAVLFKAKRGKYFFLPYARVDQEKLKIIVTFLKKLAKEMKIDFIRISPLADAGEENKNMFAKMGFRDAPVHMMHPELLWLLDLSKDEKKLLEGMRKNTRYAIKQAEKFDLKIESGASEIFLEKFYKIHKETARRQGFVPYSWDYLKAQLEVFGPTDQMKIYLAEYENQVISAAIIMYYGCEGVYHHGASLSEFNKIPGSYLIQWEAIKEAKRRGLKNYNFWGVVENAPKHPWAGLSFFKQGFGGNGRTLLHCQDLPITWKYWLNFLVETVRRIKRGY
jgi:lipid II:glycine glycyltransferase (peptidoglycan interpeptide bridge formation enzyme)